MRLTAAFYARRRINIACAIFNFYLREKLYPLISNYNFVGCNRQSRITPPNGKMKNGKTIYVQCKRIKENDASP
jgi:hypothetical protein